MSKRTELHKLLAEQHVSLTGLTQEERRIVIKFILERRRANLLGAQEAVRDWLRETTSEMESEEFKDVATDKITSVETPTRKKRGMPSLHPEIVPGVRMKAEAKKRTRTPSSVIHDFLERELSTNRRHAKTLEKLTDAAMQIGSGMDALGGTRDTIRASLRSALHRHKTRYVTTGEKPERWLKKRQPKSRPRKKKSAR